MDSGSTLGWRLEPLAMALMVIIAVASGGCPSYRRDAGCAIVASPGWAPELRGYVLTGANPGLPEKPLPVVCESDPKRRVRAVDDLVAIRDGSATLDDGEHHVCPPLGCKMKPEEPATMEKPCGATACENLEYAVVGGPTTVHLLFYDDPSAHDSQGTAKPGCYYRLWSVGLTWIGRSWE